MKKEDYVQCSLIKNNTHQKAWIPKKFAVKDKYIKLKQEDDTWEDGWCVLSVGDVVLDGAVLAERNQDYKQTRRASDI